MKLFIRTIVIFLYAYFLDAVAFFMWLWALYLLGVQNAKDGLLKRKIQRIEKKHLKRYVYPKKY